MLSELYINSATYPKSYSLSAIEKNALFNKLLMTTLHLVSRTSVFYGISSMNNKRAECSRNSKVNKLVES